MKDKNERVYKDIVQDIIKIRTGVFSFTIKTNNSIIVDYLLTTQAKYDVFKKQVVYHNEPVVAGVKAKTMEVNMFMNIVKEVINECPFGATTFTLSIRNYVPLLGSLVVSINQRKKYKVDN